MDRKYRFKAVALVIAVLVALVTVIFVSDGGSGGDSGSGNFVTFLPIWFAIFLPIIIARQQREKARRQIDIEDEDIYSVMNRVVEDLDDDETAYLKQRLQRKFGDTLNGHA